MAKKDKGKDKRRDMEMFSFGQFRRSIVVLPQPKGKFRNLFAERGMMPKPKRTCDCGKSE